MAISNTGLKKNSKDLTEVSCTSSSSAKKLSPSSSQVKVIFRISGAKESAGRDTTLPSSPMSQCYITADTQ